MQWSFFSFLDLILVKRFWWTVWNTWIPCWTKCLTTHYWISCTQRTENSAKLLCSLQTSAYLLDMSIEHWNWQFASCNLVNFVEFNIMVIVNLRTTFTKCANVIYFFTAEKPVNSSMRSLCSSLSELCHIDHANIQAWLRRIILGVEEDKGNTGKMADNRLLLQTFATHIVKESRYNTLRGLVM